MYDGVPLIPFYPVVCDSCPDHRFPMGMCLSIYHLLETFLRFLPSPWCYLSWCGINHCSCRYIMQYPWTGSLFVNSILSPLYLHLLLFWEGGGHFWLEFMNLQLLMDWTLLLLMTVHWLLIPYLSRLINSVFLSFYWEVDYCSN